MNPISFKSTFIKPINIEKLDSDGVYKPIKANFIELDYNDGNALQKVIDNWKEYGDKSIFNTSCDSLAQPNIREIEQEKFLPLTKGMKKEDIPPFLCAKVSGQHIYAVTLQEDTFTKIDPDKILGLTEFNVKEPRNELKLLQTKPDCISAKYGYNIFSKFKNKIRDLLGIKKEEYKRPYKKIGSAIVENLQEMHNDKIMEVVPVDEAKKFYKQHGFNLNLYTLYDYIWIPPNIK